MPDFKSFLTPALTPENVDLFVIRRAILTALSAVLPELTGTVLDIGCGYMPYKPLVLSPPSRASHYLGLDLPNNGYAEPDLTWDGIRIPLEDHSVEAALATEVLEHCPHPLGLLQEARRVLKPHGLFFFTVPFIWPLHSVPFDEYRYTPFALQRLLHEAGFNQVRIQATGGWDAALAQMIGLWIKRGPLRPRQQQWLTHLAIPVMRRLLERDRPPQAFHESCMLTGMSGTAIAP